MSFLPYDQKIIDKINSSKVWKLTIDLPCEKGFYEAGTIFFSDKMILLHYDNDTQECVFKEKNAADGMEIKINANDFEQYFEADEQINEILDMKKKVKSERDEEMYPYEVWELIFFTVFFVGVMLGIIANGIFSAIGLIAIFLMVSSALVMIILGTKSSKIDNSYDEIFEDLEAKEKAYLSEEHDIGMKKE